MDTHTRHCTPLFSRFKYIKRVYSPRCKTVSMPKAGIYSCEIIHCWPVPYFISALSQMFYHSLTLYRCRWRAQYIKCSSWHSLMCHLLFRSLFSLLVSDQDGSTHAPSFSFHVSVLLSLRFAFLFLLSTCLSWGTACCWHIDWIGNYFWLNRSQLTLQHGYWALLIQSALCWFSSSTRASILKPLPI